MYYFVHHFNYYPKLSISSYAQEHLPTHTNRHNQLMCNCLYITLYIAQPLLIYYTIFFANRSQKVRNEGMYVKIQSKLKRFFFQKFFSFRLKSSKFV